MFVGFLWGNLLNVLDKVLGLCYVHGLFCLIFVHIICMMCTPAYEYIYIYACVKCLAGDGVTMFTLQLLAACLDPVINFYHAS